MEKRTKHSDAKEGNSRFSAHEGWKHSKKMENFIKKTYEKLGVEFHIIDPALFEPLIFHILAIIVKIYIWQIKPEKKQ